MNDKIESTINVLPPFKRMCMTIGELPASYLETMTYYETLLWLIKYLQETVIPTINNNALAVAELQELFKKLQDYVNDYFDNLDVQEEINNKLDEMVEDGSFEAIVNQFFDNKLDYYEITNQTEDEVQELFNIERAKVISFKNDFTFTKTMILNANTTILLNNNNITFDIPNVVADYTASHGFFNFNSTDEILEYNGNGNISIMGGTITGGNCSFCHAKNITFKNIHFLNCKNDHILEMAAINGLNIINCIFQGASGISDNKEYVQFDLMKRTNFPWFDSENNLSYDDTITQNINILDCKFIAPTETGYQFVKGVGMHSIDENVMFENLKIDNCLFENMQNMAIELFNFRNIQITNNKFTQESLTSGIVGAMIRTRYTIENLLIDNNVFSGNVRAFQMAARYRESKNITISNNKFSNYHYSTRNESLINIRTTKNTRIINNIFEDYTQRCIQINQASDYGVPYDDINFDYLNYQTFIESNLFLPKSNNPGNAIYTYYGVTYIENNIFNTDGYTTDVVMASDADSGNLKQMYTKNNHFSSDIWTVNRTIYSNKKNYNEVYDIKRNAWTNLGENEIYSLDNQEIDSNLDFTQFNTLNLEMGEAGNHQNIEIRGNRYSYKFEPYTYRIPVVLTSNSIGYVTFRINEDNTFDFISSDGTLAIRSVTLINKL